MAFNIINLTPLENGKNNKISTLWTFDNKDGDTITTAGYFNKLCGLKNNDVVIEVNTTAATISFYKISVDATTEIITASKMTLS